MASLNTRGPTLQTFFCPDCHAEELALSGHTPICYGGYSKLYYESDFHPSGRERVTSVLYALGRYSDETGTVSAMSWHMQWLIQHG